MLHIADNEAQKDKSKPKDCNKAYFNKIDHFFIENRI